jgi:hypothetical protein
MTFGHGTKLLSVTLQESKQSVYLRYPNEQHPIQASIIHRKHLTCVSCTFEIFSLIQAVITSITTLTLSIRSTKGIVLCAEVSLQDFVPIFCSEHAPTHDFSRFF